MGRCSTKVQYKECSGFQIRYIFQVVQRALCLQSNIYGRRAQSELRSLRTGGNQAALGDRLGLGQPPTALGSAYTEPSPTPPGSWSLLSSLLSRLTASPPG
jgi:hypothetical protein